MAKPARVNDDTIIMRPPRRDRRWIGVVAALALVVTSGAAWLHFAPGREVARPPAIQPLQEPIAWADETTIGAHGSNELAIFRFTPNPRILVLDFPDLGSQGRTLNRVAAWAEKAGAPHDRILDDTQLASLIRLSGATPETFYYGHDYAASKLEEFFAVAERDHVVLRPEERWLHRLLAQAEADKMGLAALISLTRAGADTGIDAGVRAVILHHELSHGEFFANDAYARFVLSVWREVLTDAERAQFRDFLRRDGYDPAIEDLMVNEMQAYLMYTPDKRFFDAASLGIDPTRLAAIRYAFAAGMPSCWLRDVTPGRLASPRRRRHCRSSMRGRIHFEGPAKPAQAVARRLKVGQIFPKRLAVRAAGWQDRRC